MLSASVFTAFNSGGVKPFSPSLGAAPPAAAAALSPSAYSLPVEPLSSLN